MKKRLHRTIPLPKAESKIALNLTENDDFGARFGIV